jgi:colanic acid/amylovoran biosynthesis protein
MAKLCDRLAENYAASLVFVPNCLAANDDDRVSIREIHSRMKNRESARCIEEEMTLEETMAAIGQCDLFIGTRLHAEIFASVQGVPLVALVGTVDRGYPA